VSGQEKYGREKSYVLNTKLTNSGVGKTQKKGRERSRGRGFLFPAASEKRGNGFKVLQGEEKFGRTENGGKEC